MSTDADEADTPLRHPVPPFTEEAARVRCRPPMTPTCRFGDVTATAMSGSTMNKLTIRAIGGPTAVLDYAGLRVVLDPTFDDPRTYQNGPVTATKLAGPTAAPEDIGQADVVLVSHEHHIDNLDISGREYARQARRVFTTTAGLRNLGPLRSACGCSSTPRSPMCGSRRSRRCTGRQRSAWSTAR
ncbi:hypothetical protein NKG94_03045 [Micromonospora sp. M12]